MLNVANLEKRYVNERGERKGGVTDVNFRVEEGELFTLLGPSGCGKTTTLRSVAGLETPDFGVIELGDKAIFDRSRRINVPMHERDIGMVFQSYAIWPHMNVFENAAYPLRVRRNQKISRSELTRRVDNALEMVGLAEFRNRSATKLSGGQQQRLALARALVREPKLLLLDEPLSNLDALLREQMRSEIKRLQTEWGVTTIYVTHDQSEAMALSDRIAVLDNAEVIQIGTPSDIYDRPNSEFVANFIGRTNILRGKATQPVKAGEFVHFDQPFGRIVGSAVHDLPAGADIAFVIRPENIDIVNGAYTPAADTQNLVEGTVRQKVFLGEIAEYVIQLPGSHEVLARTKPSSSLSEGDAVKVIMPPEKVIAIG